MTIPRISATSEKEAEVGAPEKEIIERGVIEFRRWEEEHSVDESGASDKTVEELINTLFTVFVKKLRPEVYPRK